MANEEESKLRRFLEWLQFNGAELRGCEIKYRDSTKGFGIVSKDNVSDEILLVVPLDLAITPARVLQDPLLGPDCRSMHEKGEVDDRLLVMVFLIVERIRENSVWKPYLDVLPTTFGTPLWFNDDELLELKGTSLHRATLLQRTSLHSQFDNIVKNLVEKILAIDGNSKTTVCFDDFLWANSIFWSRALSIPLPRSCAFPQVDDDQNCDLPSDNINDESLSTSNHEGRTTSADMIQDEAACVEGLVPGIDFCNHVLKAAATWEVDNTGSATGVRNSMYLLSVRQMKDNEEIYISYGNKGNEELLCLYGFVIDENPDDFLMVHYPIDAIQKVTFLESKTQLLEAQKGKLKCLLPRSLLEQGFFPSSLSEKDGKKLMEQKSSNYSWSGQRKMPSYLNKLVFPDDFLTSLRTIVMQEEELYQVSSMLHENDEMHPSSFLTLAGFANGLVFGITRIIDLGEKLFGKPLSQEIHLEEIYQPFKFQLVGSDEERSPSDIDVRAAIWEVCGDSGALQLLVDLLNMKMMDLEEGSGTEDLDCELLLLEKDVSRRRGQKELARRFLKEAEHALHLALTLEGN